MVAVTAVTSRVKGMQYCNLLYLGKTTSVIRYIAGNIGHNPEPISLIDYFLDMSIWSTYTQDMSIK